MTGPNVQLRSTDIRAHAVKIDAQADLVHEAKAAASHVAMQDDAYGFICSPIIVPLLSHFFENEAVSSIGKCGDSLSSLADSLRFLADTVQAVEEANVKTLGGN